MPDTLLAVMGDSDFPPEYIACIERMGQVLEFAKARGMKPRFAMPPDNIFLAAPLDELAEQICRNDDAIALMPLLIEAAKGDPTVVQLDVALRKLGHPFDVVPISELIPPGFQLAGFPQKGGST